MYYYRSILHFVFTSRKESVSETFISPWCCAVSEGSCWRIARGWQLPRRPRNRPCLRWTLLTSFGSRTLLKWEALLPGGCSSLPSSASLSLACLSSEFLSLSLIRCPHQDILLGRLIRGEFSAALSSFDRGTFANSPTTTVPPDNVTNFRLQFTCFLFMQRFTVLSVQNFDAPLVNLFCVNFLLLAWKEFCLRQDFCGCGAMRRAPRPESYYRLSSSNSNPNCDGRGPPSPPASPLSWTATGGQSHQIVRLQIKNLILENWPILKSRLCLDIS